MATVTAKAKRRAQVQQRISDNMAELAEQLSIELPAEPRPVRDVELAAIIDLERQADLLDAILAAVAEEDVDAETPGSDQASVESDGEDPEVEAGDSDDDSDLQLDREAFMVLKFADLKSLAVGAGAEGVEPMRSRAEVVDAMEAQLASLSFESAPVEIVDGVARPAGADAGTED